MAQNTPSNTQNPTAGGEAKKSSKSFTFVLIALVLVGGIFGITQYIHSQHHEETDDAQIDGNISPVIPRVSGYVTEIRVNDNEYVKKGDTLLILDDRDLKLKLDQAEAALATAQSTYGAAEATSNASKANITSTGAGVSTIDAQIEAAQVNVWRATQDYNRYANLIKDSSITRQQFEQAQASKETAERQLDVLKKQRDQVSQQTSTVASQSNATTQQASVAGAVIKQREVDVEDAKLNLSYTVIVAPDNGLVSKVYVQEGQFLVAGQSLFSIVLDQGVWVTANFKETQLEKMKIGQKVIVNADVFPGHDFEATVSSFSPATGSRFALLPPDNASGNFVKVVQRLPVKIEFSNPSDSLVKQLRSGMNVNVDVHLN
jgi:membrane fusion protein, multidrug efflux system